MAKQKIYRQGDVLFVEISSIPKSDVVQLSHRIIAEGEATCHKHEIAEESALLYESIPDIYKIGYDKQMEETSKYLKVLSKSKVVHNEHGTILLPKGNYKVVMQREYSPADEKGRGYRYVID